MPTYSFLTMLILAMNRRAWSITQTPHLLRCQRRDTIKYHIGSIIVLPADTDPNPFRFQDILPHFILLALLAGVNVLPTQHRPTNRTTNITHGMLARDQVPRHSFILIRIRQRNRMRVNMTRCTLYQIRPPVTACKALADDLRRQAEISIAFCTVQTGGVPLEEFVVRRNDDARRAGGGDGGGGAEERVGGRG
jgi:hypothetical protein